MDKKLSPGNGMRKEVVNMEEEPTTSTPFSTEEVDLERQQQDNTTSTSEANGQHGSKAAEVAAEVAAGSETSSNSSSNSRRRRELNGIPRENQSKQLVGRYEVWPGNEKFFCGGRCVTGPYYWGIIGTAFLIVLPCSVFLGLVAFPLYTEIDYGIILLILGFALTALSTCSLFLSGCMDPGIIPRAPAPASTEHLPRTRNVEVNGHMVVVRYNETCNFYQPPRAHHCSVLNDCIERFDHYCPWVGTTIGKRNYRFYLLFVFSSSFLCIYTFACSAYLVKLRADEPDTNVVEAMKKEPAALFMMVYVFIGFWFVGGLSGFHIYLLSKNQTTYENIRYSYDRNHTNPYHKGCLSNWAEVFCVKIPPRNCDFSAKVDALTIDNKPVEIALVDQN